MTRKSVASLKSVPEARKANVVPIESAPVVSKLIQQYGCGPVQFSGSNDALYERHLIFDNVVGVTASTARMRYEAVAHAIRDILSQRWVRTESTYQQKNPKRVYY